MNRATKIIVIASNLAALWLLVRLVSRGVPPISTPAAMAFAGSLVLSFFAGELVVGVLLALIYLVPTLCAAYLGTFQFSYYAIWLAGLSGAMMPAALRSRWAYPARWAAPLVFWALAIALVWPIVVLRELDFEPALLARGNLWLARSAITVPTALTWILNVVSIALTGLLFLDWLQTTYAHDGLRFERRVIRPLFAGAALSACVGAYQSLIDLNFLNRSMWPSLRRTVGTMWDANAFGAASALWVPIAAAFAVRRTEQRALSAAAGFLCLIFCLAVWGSGSRSALMIALVGTLVLAAQAVRSVSGRRLIALLAAVAVVGAVVVIARPGTTIGPWRRSMEQIAGPNVSATGLKKIALQAWSRDMYGPAGAHMIAQHPLVGIGIGGFNYQFADALYAIDPAALKTPDNAQNWYRQQLAEVGFLGSIGWLTWMGMCVWMLVRERGDPQQWAELSAVKGTIVGFALGSLFGVLAQDAAVALTFITLLCWCVVLTQARPHHTLDTRHTGRPSRWEWRAVMALLFCFLGGTAYAAWHDLRPPYRAMRADFPYRYGFHDLDPRTPGFLWTGRRAVDVFSAEKRWMKIVLGPVAPDAATRPVEVSVWYNRQLILRVARRSDFPLTRYIRLPEAGKRVMIEIDVDRTWRPADFGLGSGREEQGVAVAPWVFSDEDPAKGSLTIE